MNIKVAAFTVSKKSNNTYFVDHLCFLCLVFLMLLRLFIAALWSHAGKGLTSWLMFLLLSQVVSWIRCGTWLYCFLIFAVFFTLTWQYRKRARSCLHDITRESVADRPVCFAEALLVKILPPDMTLWQRYDIKKLTGWRRFM